MPPPETTPGIAEAAATPAVRRAVRFAPLIRLFGWMRLVRGQVRKTLIERSADPSWVTPEVVDSYLGNGRDFDSVQRTYRLLARAREPELLARHLGEVRCPVRLLIGQAPHRGGIPPEELGRMRAQLPSLSIEAVPGSGHFIAEEAPDAVVSGVKRLLADAVDPEPCSDPSCARRPPGRPGGSPRPAP